MRQLEADYRVIQGVIEDSENEHFDSPLLKNFQNPEEEFKSKNKNALQNNLSMGMLDFDFEVIKDTPQL